MSKKRNKEITISLILSIILLFMSVYYALKAYDDFINTSVTYINNKLGKWNIEFDKETYKESKGSVKGNIEVNSTKISYDVTLPNINDYYEFTIDIRNYGTIDAILNQIRIYIPEDKAKYIDFTITYDNHTYKGLTDSGLNIPLDKDTSKKVTLRVQYILPETKKNISEGQNFNISVYFDYIEKESWLIVK